MSQHSRRGGYSEEFLISTFWHHIVENLKRYLGCSSAKHKSKCKKVNRAHLRWQTERAIVFFFCNSSHFLHFTLITFGKGRLKYNFLLNKFIPYLDPLRSAVKLQILIETQNTRTYGLVILHKTRILILVLISRSKGATFSTVFY